MAIIHTTPKRSGTEGLLKLLDALTDEIVLSHGKILMGQFSHSLCHALKLSLFIQEDVYETIGIRNVFIEDIGDNVIVRFGDKEETNMALEVLRQTKDWDAAFPTERRHAYHITDLSEAAKAVRDYLLFGKTLNADVDPRLLRAIEDIVPEKGYVEFNILATLTEYDVFK